ncbi:MAG TPA: hypothetical protein VIL77_11860 [Gaiellaceae bacterium]
MRKLVSLAAAVAAFASLAAAATAADPAPPTVVPFPAPKLGPVFVAAQTVDKTGSMQAQFAPGSSVIFRAYAVDSKTHKTVVAKDAKYFYVAIPNQPNVKLKYDPKAPGAFGRLAWTGTWTIPASYPSGTVAFKVLVKTQSKRIGQFVQMPVSTAMLTITPTPQATLGSGPAAATVAAASSSDVALYVDTVNGTQPVGAPKRPVGCTQTNVYKRGEQVVLRIWGFDLAAATVLSTDNVDTATYAIPGQAAAALNYGAHGATGAKVWFWSAPWIVPAAFPLGDVSIHITFKTDSGKTGSYDHVLTIIP